MSSGKITYRTINGKKMAVVGATKNKDGDYVGGTIIGPAKDYEESGMSLQDKTNFGTDFTDVIDAAKGFFGDLLSSDNKRKGGAVMKKRGGTFKGTF